MLTLIEPNKSLRETLWLNLTTTGGYDVKAFPNYAAFKRASAGADVAAYDKYSSESPLIIAKALFDLSVTSNQRQTIVYSFSHLTQARFDKSHIEQNVISIDIPHSQLLSFSSLIRDALA